MTTRTRAQRAARIRNREGVPEGECLAEMDYPSADCDCGICGQQPDQLARYLDTEEDE